eukprot:3855560-Lingulodinium_polyedra.AAC.1
MHQGVRRGRRRRPVELGRQAVLPEGLAALGTRVLGHEEGARRHQRQVVRPIGKKPIEAQGSGLMGVGSEGREGAAGPFEELLEPLRPPEPARGRRLGPGAVVAPHGLQRPLLVGRQGTNGGVESALVAGLARPLRLARHVVGEGDPVGTGGRPHG